MERKSQPWGRLVRLDNKSEMLLVNRECTVGRRKGCDLSFPSNKLVSGDHCKIVQDESSGEVWLEDMSTNGTVINMSKLVKKQLHPLINGDVIYFVYRKNEPEQNIAYVYESIPAEPARTDSTAFPTEILAQEEPQPSTSTSHLCIKLCPSTSEHTANPNLPDQPCTSYPVLKGMLSEQSTEVPRVREMQEPQAECCVTSLLKEEKEMEPESKRRKTDKACDVDLAGGRCGTSTTVSRESVEVTKIDKMEESLTCIICQDLLYDCVSLQPCMHTFCAACYSGWMERSSLCPTCRCHVERIRKNHILNNLVEAYLLQHPEKCRSEEDMKSMNARNKITQDMVQPKIERSFSDEEGSSDYLFELSDNDSDTSDISQPFVICRQCPSYRKEMNPAPCASGLTQEEKTGKPGGEEPSTSSKTPAVPQEYTCPPQGSHIICTCCLQPMPDRRGELAGHLFTAQQCTACHLPFCHMYWGCQRMGCQGCLSRFSEINLTDKCLDGVLNSNSYESNILQNYLASRGMSWKDMLQESLQALQQGTFHLSDYRINHGTILCHCCGLRVFKELAYIYRQNIPAAELPAAVTSRPDCYWGRNCRTQVKAHHATKFNHICEQTRFKN